MTITDFLLARIAEDEAIAEAASTPIENEDTTDSAGRWEFFEYDHEGVWPEPPRPPDGRVRYGHEGLRSDMPWAVHAERHSPARVLAECQAKREVIRLLTDYYGPYSGEDPETIGGGISYLATAYADHPDYDQSWRHA